MSVWSDGKEYRCSECGERWKPRSRYVFWPISLKWQRGVARQFFAWHGFQVGWDGIEQRVYGHTVHIGALKIVFGSGRDVKPKRDHQKCAVLSTEATCPT